MPDTVPIYKPEEGARAHSFGYIQSETQVLAHAFGGEKNEVAWAGGFVNSWMFSQKHALIHRLPL
jgi:hypothetical protein